MGNRDDHAKNFSYLYDEPCGAWTLSPAYDLTRNDGMNGEHATTVNDKGRNIELEDLLAVGMRAGLTLSRARAIAYEARDAVAGVRRKEIPMSDSAVSRLERVWGSEGLARLAAARVMVLGLGGVGSSCVEALARGGVGRLVVVDHDVVQESNINRQAIAFRSTVGRKKVEVMRAMVADINPAADVLALERFALAEEVEALLADVEAAAGPLDYVVDAIDTVSAKLALAKFAEERGLRLISSMGAANKLHPEALRFADLPHTVNCPLCRVMRKEARKRGIRHLRVLYSCEQPVKVPPREGAERRERSNLGTASYLPPIMGQMIAAEVIRELMGLAHDGGAGGIGCDGAMRAAGVERGAGRGGGCASPECGEGVALCKAHEKARTEGARVEDAEEWRR